MFLGYLKLNVKCLSFYLINLASLAPPSLGELGRLGRGAFPPLTHMVGSVARGGGSGPVLHTHFPMTVVHNRTSKLLWLYTEWIFRPVWPSLFSHVPLGIECR